MTVTVGMHFRLTMIAFWTALLFAGPSLAVDPQMSVNDLRRSSFTLENGVAMTVQSLAQSPDGYLWLGTTTGLYRFDGVSFEHFMVAPDNEKSEDVSAVLVARSGQIWVGHSTGGVSILAKGRLANPGPGAPVEPVSRIVEATGGDIWIATMSDGVTRLRRVGAGGWSAPRDDWIIPGQIQDLLAGQSGTIWMIVDRKLLLLRPAQRRIEIVGGTSFDGRLARGPDGSLWLADAGGIHRISWSGDLDHPMIEMASHPLPLRIADQHVIIDRHNVLWDVSPTLGLLRVSLDRKDTGLPPSDRQQKMGQLPPGQGAPSSAHAIVEDREGNIWIGTELGLDRFRSTSILRSAGVSDLPGTSRRGKRTHYQLWQDGQSHIFVRNGNRIVMLGDDGAPIILSANVSDDATICASQAGGLWLRDRPRRLQRLGATGVISIPLPPDFPAMAYMSACVEDAKGNLWLAYWGAGIFRYGKGSWERHAFKPATKSLAVLSMVVSPAGTVMTYTGDGWIARNVAGSPTQWIRTPRFARSVNITHFGSHDLFLGTESGMIMFDGRRFRKVSAERFPFLRDLSDIVETRRGETWLMTTSQILRFPTRQLESAFIDPNARLAPQIFDAEDGFAGLPEQSCFQSMFEDARGVIWYSTNDGVFRVDPARLHRNRVAPIVLNRSVVASAVSYEPHDDLRLPAGTSRVRFDYTATSLSIPKRTRFAYRLEGFDPGWVDAETRREAFYTALTPGHYRFDVSAANEDGVWSRTPASFTFDIPPTFLQSIWFQAICVLLVVVALWLLYELRLNQVAARIQRALQERVSERERIARELHDTFLQSVQGLVMRFQSVAYRMPENAETRTLMEESLAQARTVIAEGRDRVIALRASGERNALPALLQEAAARIIDLDRIGVTMTIEGKARPLDPTVSDEIIGICDEALFNIVRHAEAKQVTIDVQYGRRRLTIAITDDGKGIDPDPLLSSRTGHFGLTGMHERAGRLGASLTVSSVVAEGTRIVLTVPASKAFPPKTGWLWRLGRHPATRVT